MVNVTGNPDHFLEMSNISKKFPGVQALDAASLSIKAGEIHGLVGENGAGKSTIIKILAGVYTADVGTITIDGTLQQAHSPASVHAAGVRFIHQELNLVPHFTVMETVFMGQELGSVFGLQKRRMKQRARDFLRESLDYDIPVNKLIRDLGVAERKLVQIARALIDDQATVVVFDEPTGPLASNEVEQLFGAIKSLAERGIAILYVSHYLGEITDLCDRVTVFRNGCDVAVLDGHTDATSTNTIIQHMVGRDITSLYPQRAAAGTASVFRATELSCQPFFEKIDLQVKQGEIVGIAGLVGSGREALVDVLYGLKKSSAGVIEIGNNKLDINNPHRAVNNGIVLVPRDRRNSGLVLEMSVTDNINLASLDEVSVLKLERGSLARKRAAELINKLDIRPPNAKAIVRYLSGGNQQKVVLARWLATGSKLYILDEPAIGVDIGAKVEIYQLIADLANGTAGNSAEPAGVIISSSDPAELLGLCDRIVVLHRGRIVASKKATEFTLDSLLAMTTGGVAGTGLETETASASTS